MSEEPVFIRSKLGTSRYVYNHRNPVGLALTILTPLVALGVLFGMQAESTWSEGELRDAVRKGVQDLSAVPLMIYDMIVDLPVSSLPGEGEVVQAGDA
ncbi:hypothetical protein ACFXPY_35300, partial [Streptomyces sp. NPDC059153]